MKIDGVKLAEGDKILVTNQSEPTQNSGSPLRNVFSYLFKRPAVTNNGVYTVGVVAKGGVKDED